MSIDYDAHEALRQTSCRGASCRQGRAPCRENCNPMPEMACTAGEDSDQSEWRFGLILAAVLLVGVIGVLVFAFADPFLALVRK